MRNLLLTILFIFCITPVYANFFATYTEGDAITYLPKEGQIVKEGEPLVKWDKRKLELTVKSLKLALKDAKECLKDAKTDLDREKILHEHKAASTASYEYIEYLYTYKKLYVEKIKLEIKYWQMTLDGYTCPAPYDLKVLKHLVSIGSGSKIGEKILEVEKLQNP